MGIRRELVSWEEVDRLIQYLLPQFEGEFDSMVMITRGGVIPGGLLAEAMNITRRNGTGTRRSLRLAALHPVPGQ